MPTTEAQRRAMKNYNNSEKGKQRLAEFYQKRGTTANEYSKKRYTFIKQLKEQSNMLEAFV